MLSQSAARELPLNASAKLIRQRTSEVRLLRLQREAQAQRDAEERSLRETLATRRAHMNSESADPVLLLANDRQIQERMHRVRKTRHQALLHCIAATAAAATAAVATTDAAAAEPADAATPQRTPPTLEQPRSSASMSSPTADKRQARALARLPDLRKLLFEDDTSSAALTAGQRAFCCDGTLLRYLHAHPEKHSASKAHSALRATLKWRDAHGFDPDPAAAELRTCEQCDADPTSHCFFSIGHDKRGWAVLYCCPPRSALKDPASSSLHAFKCIEAAMEQAPGG